MFQLRLVKKQSIKILELRIITLGDGKPNYSDDLIKVSHFLIRF